MPQTIVMTTDRLLAAVGDVRALLPVLQAMLAEPDKQGQRTGTIGRKPDGSEPWNSPAASAYFDIWYGAGDIVHNMRWDIGVKGGGGAVSGPDALDAILNYAPSVSGEALTAATRRLERWADRARQLPAIDESEPWTAVPTIPATGHPPACPYCGTYGLRMRQRRGEVCCFFPGCADSEGSPTRARMEPGRMTGEARLVFGDGMTMHWGG